MVKVTTAIKMQDRLIGNGGDPITSLIQIEIILLLISLFTFYIL